MADPDFITFQRLPGPPEILLLKQVGGRARTLRLAGEITARGAIGDVVALIAQAGWAGELVVLSVDAEAEGRPGRTAASRWRSRSLFFEQGHVLGALTTVPGERIGPLLQRLGHLDQRQMESIETSMQAAPGGRRFGEVAVQLGLVTRERLFEVIGLQVKEIAFAMFLVERGMLYFLDGYDPERVATQHRLGANSLLMESLQRMDETSYFRERIPSDDHVPVPVAGRGDPQADLVPFWRAVDGKRSVREVARRCSRPTFDVLRALCQLAQAGFVRIRAPGPAGGAAELVGVFNDAMGIIFQVAQRASVTGVVRQHLAGFSASLPVYAQLFAGAGPGEDGRVDAERVTENLRALGEAGDELAQRLYPYVAYALFAVGSLVAKEDERLLAEQVSPLIRRLAPAGESR
jgi:hypothetical protein